MKSRYIFQRNSNADLPIVVGGDGCYLIDKDGKRYLDGSSGAAVSCLGHSDEYVKDEIKKQIQGLSYVHSSFFTNEPAEKLARVTPPRTKITGADFKKLKKVDKKKKKKK